MLTECKLIRDRNSSCGLINVFPVYLSFMPATDKQKNNINLCLKYAFISFSYLTRTFLPITME